METGKWEVWVLMKTNVWCFIFMQLPNLLWLKMMMWMDLNEGALHSILRNMNKFISDFLQ